jgi:hypothetical protein
MNDWGRKDSAAEANGERNENADKPAASLQEFLSGHLRVKGYFYVG